jgi:ribosomal protein L31
MKKNIHPKYHDEVAVNCLCGNSFVISATIPGPVKVETCPKCHTVYNKWIVVAKVIKGRMEKFLEKQKKIEAVQWKSK